VIDQLNVERDPRSPYMQRDRHSTIPPSHSLQHYNDIQAHVSHPPMATILSSCRVGSQPAPLAAHRGPATRPNAETCRLCDGRE
jgi:hypothetical protein